MAVQERKPKVTEQITDYIREEWTKKREAWKMDLIREWENSPKTKAKGVAVVRNSDSVPIWANAKNNQWNFVIDRKLTEPVQEQDVSRWLLGHFRKGTPFTLKYTDIYIQLLHTRDNPRKNFCVLAGTPINYRSVIK